MIYQLMRRDPAWAALPAFVVIFLAGGLAAALVKEVHGAAVMLPVVAILFGVAIIGSAQQHTTGFLSALPISKRQLFLARVAALMTLVWFPSLLAAAISRDSLFIVVAAAAMPLGLGLQSLAIRQIRLPNWTGPAVLATVMGWLGMAVALSRTVWNVPVSLVLAIGVLVSAVLFVSTWHAIPQIREPRERTEPTSTDASGKASIRAPFFPWWLFSWWDGVWLLLSAVTTFAGQWVASLIFAVGAGQGRERVRWLDSLPVSRRTIFATRMTPIMMGLILGYLAGSHVGLAGQYAWRHISIRPSPQGCGNSTVEPPFDYWELAKRSQPAPVVAPWGESFRPPVVRVYGFDVYDPYAVGCGNSKQFFDWQYRRASQAAYGKLVNAGRYPLAAAPRLRTEVITVSAISMFTMLCFFPLVLNDWWRFRRLPTAVRITVLASSVIAFFGLIIALAVFSTGWVGGLEVGNCLQWLSWSLPENMAVATGISFAVPVAFYFVLQRVFLASEFMTTARVRAQ